MRDERSLSGALGSAASSSPAVLRGGGVPGQQARLGARGECRFLGGELRLGQHACGRWSRRRWEAATRSGSSPRPETGPARGSPAQGMVRPAWERVCEHSGKHNSVPGSSALAAPDWGYAQRPPVLWCESLLSRFSLFAILKCAVNSCPESRGRTQPRLCIGPGTPTPGLPG